METKALKLNKIHLLAKMAQNGEVIAFPTETVYGLGVIFDREDAFEKLVKVKERRADKPFTLMLPFTRLISDFAKVDDKTRAIIDAFLPGELTLILEANQGLPKHVTLGSKYIGIRVSANHHVANLITLIGKPLLVPSANKKDEKPALTASEVLSIFNGEIAGILEGETTSHIPSTIVKISDKIELVREGSIPFPKILKVWEETK
ncbi:MAG: L-threonylcarbamoyladenylate synthase [Bacilli bacterium]